MYALAASAAGVGMLTLAQPAEAKIVYTPTHVRIGDHLLVDVDLNHDGKKDFTIGESTWTTYMGMQVAMLSVIGDQTGNGIAAHFGFGYAAASALAAAVRVGPKITTLAGPQVMAYEYLVGGREPQCRGPWDNVRRRYLGLKFVIKGKTHFGWARLNVEAKCSLPLKGQVTAVLTGYAYETIPGKGIVAGATKGPDDSIGEQLDTAVLAAPEPEPASLGLFAQGAAGLVAWRRRDTPEEDSL